MVYAVRRFAGQERVGHAGTLDPMATGVLVLCLGAAVRITEYLIDHDKVYRATVRLGVETDTYDATGEVVAEKPVALAPEQVTAALMGFVGPLQQVPPAYSAIKVQGVHQYQRARRGQAVALAPRAVEIYSIAVRRVEGDLVEFDVACSKGTYVRSLAHDLGERLGVGGHLAALRRLASGPFTIQEAHSLDSLARAAEEKALESLLLPLDRGLEQFEPVYLEAAQAQAIVNGRAVACSGPAPRTALVRAYARDGRIIALLSVAERQLKPYKVFTTNADPA